MADHKDAHSPPDPVNHPPHYNTGGIEAIEVILDQFKNDYCLGAAYKYLHRCRYKGRLVQDLQKAIWYLEKRIEQEEIREDWGDSVEEKITHTVAHARTEMEESGYCYVCGLYHVNKPPCREKEKGAHDA